MNIKLKSTKGITLIALVITIIVLLILAGVSIATLTGENGILTQAGKAKDETETKQLEEIVSVALTGLVAEREGDRSGITPEMIANEVNRQEGRTDVTAEKSTFPTYIVFSKEKKKVGVNLEVKVGEFESYNGIYSEPGLEGKIAPQELFDYEIISEGETGAISMDNLPTKEVRITGIKPQYCNGNGYNPETDSRDLTDTNYDIIFEGKKIDGTFVIPYQLEINGEMYKVTEVNIRALGKSIDNDWGSLMPNIDTLVYPNTIRKVYGTIYSDVVGNTTLRRVVLPNSLIEIGNYAFSSCKNLTNIVIPENVTSIGGETFYNCYNLETINIRKAEGSITGAPWGYWGSSLTINWNYTGD